MSDDMLLADLVSSFPGNTEDIATEALCHIFRHSVACMKALNDVVKSGVRGVNPINSVKTQVIGVDGTRPDLVCCDQTGQERVLMEVKFWAPLTANQPNGYIKRRLPEDGPAVLMFLVPDDRVSYLWPQLRERLRELGPFEEIDAERRCVRIGDTQQHLMVVSWEGLLDAMAARSSDSGEPGTVTQIRQLRSLALCAGDQGLKPIRSDTESVMSENRLHQYRRLIDATTAKGVKQGWVDRKGLHRASKSYGYGRYISLCGNVVWFGINKDLFETTRTTPLWASRHHSNADEPDVSRELGKEDQDWYHRHGRYWFPIELMRDVEDPQILAGVVKSLRRYGDDLQAARKTIERRASGSTVSSSASAEATDVR
ncbi:hypothetical protein [Candidatus Spongiisocius sp.]|uniref:hypothetical protein n=1 Tax=Candidatus Spongiisocius sp. TaxID=3101273 RepID=UPI003B5BC0DF